MQIIQDHGDDINQDIIQKIMNMDVFNLVRERTYQLHPIAIAIDQVFAPILASPPREDPEMFQASHHSLLHPSTYKCTQSTWEVVSV